MHIKLFIKARSFRFLKRIINVRKFFTYNKKNNLLKMNGQYEGHSLIDKIYSPEEQRCHMISKEM